MKDFPYASCPSQVRFPDLAAAQAAADTLTKNQAQRTYGPGWKAAGCSICGGAHTARMSVDDFRQQAARPPRLVRR